MPVSIVVGGQFGSEGKGKVAHYLAQKMEASFAVRCGGPNSGHTVIDPSGKARIFQQLPTAAILPDVKLAICAGSYIDLDILLREIQETGVGPYASNHPPIPSSMILVRLTFQGRSAS
jgi:adenylosuccinate synthase